MEEIVILIVDDNVHFSEILFKFLSLSSKNFKVLETIARTKEQAIEYANKYKPDVILMDVELTPENFDGMEAAIHIHDSGLKSKIIILTSMTLDDTLRNNSILSGAINFLNKGDLDRIVKVIKDIYETETPAESIQDDFIALKKESIIKELSPAERDLFFYTLAGKSLNKIGEITRKSYETLKSQRQSICKKLKVDDLYQAIEKYKNRGIIP